MLSRCFNSLSSFVRWTLNQELLFILFVPCAVKMCHLLSAACQDVSSFVRWTFIIIYPFCPLCYRDVSSFVSSLSRCVIFCQVDIYYYYLSFLSLVLSRCVIFCQVDIYYYLSFLSLVLSRCVIFCQQPVKMCHLLLGGHLLSFLSLVLSRCVIFCQQPVKMCHLLSGGHLLLLFILLSLVLSRCVIFCQQPVKMCHLLSGGHLLSFCPLCCQDVSSFVSSLSRCAIFCQVGIYYLSEVNHCGQQYNRGKPERAPVLLIEHGTYIAHTKIS